MWRSVPSVARKLVLDGVDIIPVPTAPSILAELLGMSSDQGPGIWIDPASRPVAPCCASAAALSQ
jgi:hypothetical protein